MFIKNSAIICPGWIRLATNNVRSHSQGGRVWGQPESVGSEYAQCNSYPPELHWIQK